MFRSKVLLAAVTALLMACSSTAAAQAGGIGMALRTRVVQDDTRADRTACRISLSRLAAATGFDIRAPGVAEPSWHATLERTGTELRVALRHPDGTLVASKTVRRRRAPCRSFLELLTILLAAHAPRVALSRPASRGAPPEPDQPLYWRAALGGGVSGLSDGAGLLLTGGGHLRAWRSLGLGARLAVVTQRRQVGPGSARVWAMDAHATAGYLAPGSLVSWAAGGLIGARITRASAEGLDENASDTVASLATGLFVDHWWTLAGRLSVGAAAAVIWLLPRAAFTVADGGTVYQTPVPNIELSLTIGWGA